LTIVCVAFGVRLLHWQNDLHTLDKTMARLTARYKEEAQFLLDGDLTSFIQGSKSQPDATILTHPPGYPILIAIIYKISDHSDRVLRLFQIACDAGAAILVFLIAARLVPRGAAILAALLVAVSPQLAFRSLVVLPDSLTALPLLAAVFLIIKAVADRNVRKLILAGGLIGVSCWLRADALLLPVFLCATLLLLFPRGERRRPALALIGGMVIVIAPITIRNALVFRSFVPVALGTGVTLCEGIADYDVEQRFGLSPTDDGTNLQEAQWVGRPDYAAELYRPDGIQREHARVARGLSVIRSHPVWFAGVMGRRLLKMFEYEPVSIVSAAPTVSHSLALIGVAPVVWSRSRDELLAESASSDPALQLVTKPITVRKNFDYVLTMPVTIRKGRAAIIVKGVERPQVLGSAALPDSLERLPYTNAFAPQIQIPFVSQDHDQVQVVIANAAAQTGRAQLDIGGGQLNELGPARYLWTRYPRKLVKTIQKFFVASYFLPLKLLGVVLLAVYRRKLALAMGLTLPVYHLLSHAPLHFEHRYSLPGYFFGFILAGFAIYWLALMCIRLVVGLAQPTKRGDDAKI
jgi:hypothetical protein